MIARNGLNGWILILFECPERHQALIEAMAAAEGSAIREHVEVAGWSGMKLGFGGLESHLGLMGALEMGLKPSFHG